MRRGQCAAGAAAAAGAAVDSRGPDAVMDASSATQTRKGTPVWSPVSSLLLFFLLVGIGSASGRAKKQQMVVRSDQLLTSVLCTNLMN
ncbi:hypothetical protein HPB47_019960 [Ixodes persulcatus]|uniref:Uncharacterized protein n=1 Tax=Ixodes persulcatus TaxID=34615 RepID=A0AC60QGW0_IXOPE|nr:hypothetical protein HPB47_019960 [Ixodes persulcatus]